MGIFGPYKCAYCGRTFRGFNWRIKNGRDICGDCKDILNKEMPYEKWHKMGITQIRAYFKEKERLEAQKECSLCGRPFGAADLYKFVLKDGAQICYSCGESVRIVRPVFCTEEYDSLKEKYSFASDDPLKEMTLDDVKAAQLEADTERRGRQDKFGPCKGAFIVDDVIRVPGEKDREVHRIWGRCVLGSASANSLAKVVRREKPYFIQIDKVEPLEYNKKAQVLSEGHGGALVASDDVSFIYPGDVLYFE